MWSVKIKTNASKISGTAPGSSVLSAEYKAMQLVLVNGIDNAAYATSSSGDLNYLSNGGPRRSTEELQLRAPSHAPLAKSAETWPQVACRTQWLSLELKVPLLKVLKFAMVVEKFP